MMQCKAATGLFVLSGFALMSCSETGPVSTRTPDILIGRSAVDFGNVQVGTTAIRTVLIRNQGNFTLELERVSRLESFSGAYDFEVGATSIAPGGATQIRISFGPKMEGEALAGFQVESSDPDTPVVEVSMRGNGVKSALVVAPTSVRFGRVLVDTTKTDIVTVSNHSESNVQITFVESRSSNIQTCTADSGSPFCVLRRNDRLDPEAPFELPAGEQIVLEVRFTPTSVGASSRATMLLSSCPAPECEVPIELDGLGVDRAFLCEPPQIDFGRVNPGACVERTITCENVANGVVTVAGWSTDDETPASISVEASRVVALSEGEHATIEVSFCPSDLSRQVGLLEIETDNSLPHLRVTPINLLGEGGGPDIEALPEQINFGLVSLIAPAYRRISIYNNGLAALEVQEVLIDAEGSDAFTAPPPAAQRLEPGEFMEVDVTFRPTQVGPAESRIFIRSDDQDEPLLEVPLRGQGIELPPCHFEVSPSFLPFGAVERGRTLSRSFEVRNTGPHDCVVTGAQLTSESASEFSLPDAEVGSLVIPPDSAGTIRVQYAPDELGDDIGAVEFTISSNVSPLNRVPLSGAGADASLLIVPNDIDFGSVSTGCETIPRGVQIYNTGSTPATVDSISIMGNATAFNLVSLPFMQPQTPLTLGPGSQASVEVSFIPDSPSSFAGAIVINGTGGGQPVTQYVNLVGAGSVDATQVDEFEQLSIPKIDILFVIDYTGSMSEEQLGLAANFDSFIQFAAAQSLDYQIGVTTTDITREAGRLIHAAGMDPFGGPTSARIVTPNTRPSPETVFTDNVSGRPLASGGPGTESGFHAAYLALRPPVIFGHNVGFLRPDAVLSIIFVSDESERSGGTIDFYVDFFKSIKGVQNGDMFSASAIVGDVPSGCNGPGGFADGGPRYILAAQRTGGVFQSICTGDWADALGTLSEVAFGFSNRFALTSLPVPSTIAVFVDGVLLPSASSGGTTHWTYESDENVISFAAAATPEPSAQIRIEYTAQCLQ